MNEETKNAIKKMRDAKPIPNPCPKMEQLGYKYEYHKGLVDETPYYVRVEEDSILYLGKRYNIMLNLASKGVVITMKENNANFYGGKPTLFLDKEVLACINEVMVKLGWYK